MASVPEEFEKAGDIANAVNNRAFLLQWNHNVDRAAGAEQMWNELQTTQAPNTPPVAGLVLFVWGNFLRDDGKFQPAMERYKQGIELLKECKCSLGIQGGIGLAMSTTATSVGNFETGLAYAIETDKIFEGRHADSLRVHSQRAIGLAYLTGQNDPKAIEAFASSLKFAKEQHVFRSSRSC